MPVPVLILDQFFFMDNKLAEAHRYWHRKRIYFNLAVGIAGFFSIRPYLSYFSGADLIDILLWALVANGVYSLGYVLDSYIIVSSKGKYSLGYSRLYLFLIGTGLCILVTYLAGNL